MRALLVSYWREGVKERGAGLSAVRLLSLLPSLAPARRGADARRGAEARRGARRSGRRRRTPASSPAAAALEGEGAAARSGGEALGSARRRGAARPSEQWPRRAAAWAIVGREGGDVLRRRSADDDGDRGWNAAALIDRH